MTASVRDFLHPGSWPIAVKLSIELVLAALVPLVLAMWITTSQTRARLVQQASDNVELLAGVTAARLDQLLIDTSRVAAILRSDELIQRFCAAPPDERQQLLPAVQRKIDLFIHSNPDFASILIDGIDGICIAATSADMVGFDYNFREYFQRAKAGEQYISPMLVGRTSNIPGVYFSAPIVAPGTNGNNETTAPSSQPPLDSTYVGVIVLKLDGRSIWRLIDGVTIGERGHAMLSNSDGVVTAHPDKAMLYRSFAPLSAERIAEIDPATQWAVPTIRSLDLPELMGVLTSARSHGTHEFTRAVADDPKSGREQWIAGFAPIHERDWVVSIVQPMDEFDQPIAAMLRKQVWIALAVALAAVALALVQARRTVRPVLAVTHAANQLARGDFDARAPKVSNDEIGQLAQAFNKMVPQLKERVDMQQSLKVAMEVQQSLLPLGDPTPPGLDVAGRSRYCDATGGDYFDFVDISQVSDSTTLIALGDVMGHGVASALLMASARAALRSHALDDGSLSNLMTKVNRVLAADARHGRFMTMSLLIINPPAGRVRWTSAGHDPIIVFHPKENRFDELGGGGMPLGIDAIEKYEEYQRDDIAAGDVLLIGTDGIWELRNLEGEMYGKPRLLQFIETHSHQTAAEMAQALLDELRAFSGDGKVQDDVTFVFVRVTSTAQPPRKTNKP